MSVKKIDNNNETRVKVYTIHTTQIHTNSIGHVNQQQEAGEIEKYANVTSTNSLEG